MFYTFSGVYFIKYHSKNSRSDSEEKLLLIFEGVQLVNKIVSNWYLFFIAFIANYFESWNIPKDKFTLSILTATRKK